MAARLNGRKLALFAAGFAFAVIIADYLLKTRTVILVILAGMTALCALIYCIIVKLQRKKLCEIMIVLLILSAGVLFGSGRWVWSYTYRYFPATGFFDTERTVAAQIVSYPRDSDYSSFVKASIRLDGIKQNVNLKLDKNYSLKPGDSVILKVKLEEPENSYDFDFTEYYFTQNIFLNCTQVGQPVIDRCNVIPLKFLPEVVNKMINERFSELFTGEELGFISALITRNRENLSQSFRLSLENTGLSHIVAVSGMHISFLTAMLLQIIKKRRLACIVAIPIMIFFVLMTGSSPSAVRSCVMQIIFLIGILIEREDEKITSLLFALLFILVVNPFAISDIGLQLSFLSTFGLIIIGKPVSSFLLEKLPRHKVKPGKITLFVVQTVSSTAGATLLTMIPVAYYFGKLSLISFISNLLVLWVLSYVFALGLLCAAMSFVMPVVAEFVAIPVEAGLKYIVLIITHLSKLPYAVVDAKNIYIVWWIVTFYVIIVLCIFSRRGKIEIIAALLASVLTFAVAIGFFSVSKYAYRAKISILNVGEGQAILVSSGDENMLIDCGGSAWSGSGNIVAEYLLLNGVSSIDALVLTHGDNDHTGGVVDLDRLVRIENVIAPKLYSDNVEKIRLLVSTLEGDPDMIEIDKNVAFELGDSDVILYKPVRRSGDNEQGICVEVQVGDFSMLVTGDIGRISELILVGRENLDESELLIAGHHGSASSTSAELLEAVSPEITVISVGENTYGHPSPEVLSRIENAASSVYRTDENGHIEILVR